MTRADIEQVYPLRKELKMWQERLAELQEDIALSPKPMDGMPFSNTNAVSHPTEDKAIKLTELDKIIKGKIAEIQLTVAEIEKFIMTISDSTVRAIVEYRCCQCKSWKEISKLFGEGYTPESIRQTYHRFICELD